MKVAVQILLKRNPIIRSSSDPFTHAYNHYKQNEEVKRPFDFTFYHKKGSMAEKRFLNAQKENGELVQVAEPEYLEWAKLKPMTDDALSSRLDRSLYLMVKNGNNYEFPAGLVKDSELLHEAGENRLNELCGNKMQTWFVGKIPIAHYDSTFIMKAYILAGKISNEHKWVTKQELAEINPSFYDKIKNILD